MSTIRFALATSVPLALLGSALSGCGQADTQHDAATRYTPESLARELAFRFADLKLEGKTTSAPPKPAAPGRSVDERAVAKTAATAKAAPESTLDDLMRDVSDKAERVEGRTRSEVLTAVAAAIDADPAIKPADKKTLLDGLKGLSGQ